jgi:hypothetical protein
MFELGQGAWRGMSDISEFYHVLILQLIWIVATSQLESLQKNERAVFSQKDNVTGQLLACG